MPIRNSTKAIIIENGRLLCNTYHDERGDYCGLPGGGQDYQETLRAALVRECQEEIDAAVVVGELIYVREYIGKNYDQFPRFKHVHQVEFFFRATLAPGAVPKLGNDADRTQTGVTWIPIAELTDRQFYPPALLPWLGKTEQPMYLGDVD